MKGKCISCDNMFVSYFSEKPVFTGQNEDDLEGLTITISLRQDKSEIRTLFLGRRRIIALRDFLNEIYSKED